MLKLNGEYMKSSIRSSLYTILPLLIFFGWLGTNLSFAPIPPGMMFDIEAQVDGVTGSLTLTLPDGVSIDNRSGQFTQDIEENMVSWTNLTAEEGTHTVTITEDASQTEKEYKLLVSSDQSDFLRMIGEDNEYIKPLNRYRKADLDGWIFASTTSNPQLRIFKGVPVMKDFPLIKNANWFWTYFLFSIILTTGLRKVLKLA